MGDRFLSRPGIPSFLSLVTIVSTSLMMNPVQERPWTKDRRARPCGYETPLLAYMTNQMVLSYTFLFVYTMTLIGPCPCTSLKPIAVIYGIIAVWAIGAGFAGTALTTIGFECVRLCVLCNAYVPSHAARAGVSTVLCLVAHVGLIRDYQSITRAACKACLESSSVFVV